MGRPRKNQVRGTVVWVDGEGCYREVIDDTTPDLELGERCVSVITDPQTGVGHFEYAKARDDG